MSDRKILVIAMLALVVLVVGGGIGLQAWRTARDPAAVPAPTYSEPPVTVTDGQPLRLGPGSAPVTVTVYEDFHCPHCADFETEFGPVLDAAQQRGAVQVELYPMSFIDAGSTSAANAMACAAEAGTGAWYHKALFANPALEWSTDQLLELAARTGGATPELTRCVTDGGRQGWVDSIDAAADANGVQGTPTVFLDGAPVDLATLTPETLEAMISDAAGR